MRSNEGIKVSFLNPHNGMQCLVDILWGFDEFSRPGLAKRFTVVLLDDLPRREKDKEVILVRNALIS